MLSVNIWTWTLLSEAVSSLCSLESAGLRWSRSCILNRLQEASVDSLQAETHSAKVCSLFTLLCHREAVTCTKAMVALSHLLWPLSSHTAKVKALLLYEHTLRLQQTRAVIGWLDFTGYYRLLLKHGEYRKAERGGAWILSSTLIAHRCSTLAFTLPILVSGAFCIFVPFRNCGKKSHRWCRGLIYSPILSNTHRYSQILTDTRVLDVIHLVLL